jgi:hypothetical protein
MLPKWSNIAPIKKCGFCFLHYIAKYAAPLYSLLPQPNPKQTKTTSGLVGIIIGKKTKRHCRRLSWF